MPCGATRTAISAATSSPSTTPRTTAGRRGRSALDRRRPAPDLQELVHQLARPARWHDLGLTVPLADHGDVGAGAVHGDRGPHPPPARMAARPLTARRSRPPLDDEGDGHE